MKSERPLRRPSYDLTEWLDTRRIYGGPYQAKVWEADGRWRVRILWVTADGERMSSREAGARSLQSAIDIVLSDVDRSHGEGVMSSPTLTEALRRAGFTHRRKLIHIGGEGCDELHDECKDMT